MKTHIKLTAYGLKEKKVPFSEKKSMFKSHLNFAQNMDFELKFVKLYHDVLEAVWGVDGQTHQKPLRITKLKCIGFKVPKKALQNSIFEIMKVCKNMRFWVWIHTLDHAGVGDVGEGGGWNHENTYKTNIQWLERNKNVTFS